MVEVPPGFTEVGDAVTTTVFGAPAVKLTVVELVNPEMLASTRAVSTWLPAVSLALAMPLASVVVTSLKVPAVVLKLTVWPDTASPLVSFTTARIVVLPLTGMLPLFAVAVTDPITVAVVFTVIVTVLATPVLVRARMTSLPLPDPAV
jgi:hypothetical protein